jgi:hypothetical protein
MDRKNILSEGFFDLFKRLPKDVRDLKLTTLEKHLYKNDSEFKKNIDLILRNAKNAEDRLKRMLAKKKGK